MNLKGANSSFLLFIQEKIFIQSNHFYKNSNHSA
ncbi:hypothetical protein AF62_05275 [Streptococcus uberis C8329]|nr:hypothetical protein AF62_05275 [Streptococcus uberis C8329]